MDPQSFFADPDPAVFLNADPDPLALIIRIRIQLKQIFQKQSYEEFVVKNIKDCSKVRNIEVYANLLLKNLINLLILPISLHFSVLI